MKLYCEVNLKDRSPSSIQDAITYACRHDELWRVRLSKQEQREEMTKQTSLEGKCGSCVHYKPFTPEFFGSECCGQCTAKMISVKRTRKACKYYENKQKQAKTSRK